MHDRSSDDSSVVRALEFYSGIGGLHLALKRSQVPGVVVQAFDWDQNAAKVYNANHGPSLAIKKDILTLSASFLASYRANLWILSPACQPYTVLNPNAQGILDPRAKSFLHLIQDVLPKLAVMRAHPTHLLIENVGGFEGSITRQILLSQLHSLGYTTVEFLLTPLQFGIPNSRLRYYLLAKISPYSDSPFTVQPEITYRYIPSRVQRSITALSTRTVPQMNAEMQLADDLNVAEICHYLDEDSLSLSDPHPHAVPDRVLEKWGRLFDIVRPSAKRTCCFTRGYTQLVERAGSIIQMNPDLDTGKTFDAFLAAQDAGMPDAISILRPLRLRYFTPSELLRIFHFNSPLHTKAIHLPSMDLSSAHNAMLIESDVDHPQCNSTSGPDFIWPDDITNKTKYRLIGNSVNVHVVTELIDFLYEDWGSESSLS
ncbi:S-adenosyl-L-methionine-dependent methyltransferase [Lentinula raphanica]|nr:S-adenosyl-L-methionine-dependent methyltransferase [Lentinula raphanica]